MQRVTLTFDDDLTAEIDRFMETRGYSNRSEAVRDLARAGLAQGIEAVGETRDCVATFSYVFAPETRELSRRLQEAIGERRNLVKARLQHPLDGAECLDVLMLEGSTVEIRAFAETILAERGVRYGRLAVVPLATT